MGWPQAHRTPLDREPLQGSVARAIQALAQLGRRQRLDGAETEDVHSSLDRDPSRCDRLQEQKQRPLIDGHRLMPDRKSCRPVPHAQSPGYAFATFQEQRNVTITGTQISTRIWSTLAASNTAS